MMLLFYIGLLICLVAGIWLLVVAFKTSVWWGLGSLLIPFVGLIFVIMHWSVAKKPFLWNVLGAVLMIVPIVSNPELLAQFSSR